MRSLMLVLLIVAMGVGCDSSTDPGEIEVDENELQFLRFPADLIPLITREGSFWAVSGDNRELSLRYAPQPGDGDEEGEEFLRFSVPGDALYARPDGTRFQRGDSIRITVRVDPQNRVLFEFEPSGLVFDPDHRPELKITYRRIGDDLNGDGRHDGSDDDLERRLNMWKREQPGDPWHILGSIKLEEAKELEAKISSFTGFCIAA